MSPSSPTPKARLQDFNPRLSRKNQSVNDFVAKLETMEEVHAAMGELKIAHERHSAVVTIMQECQWSLGDELKADTILLQENLSQLNQNMTRCEASARS